MLRFIATTILAMGLFSSVSAGEVISETADNSSFTTQTTFIDPVVRAGILKICSSIWEIRYVDLEDAYAKGSLTITPVTYGTDLAYDVAFAGNVICILDNSL
ncbi:MAG: hypothetical protein AAGN35_06025 [Bacteroidota bacterium]